MKSGALGILAWLMAGTQSCIADVDPARAPAVQWSGSVRLGYWSSSRDLDQDTNLINGSTWIKATSEPLENYRLYAEGYLSQQDLFSNRIDNTRNVLREGYLDTAAGALELKIGKQIIAWGRADRFNPTDNLTPKDFTLLTAEDDDQRIGTGAIKAVYRIDTVSITAVWLWDFQGNTVPIGPPPPGVSFTNVPVEEKYRQAAFKIDQTGKAIDWSVSYYTGYDLNPDISPALVTPTAAVVALSNNRISVVGFDAATTVGRLGLRMETAYTKTEDSDGSDPFVKNSNLYTVLGAERAFFETLTVNLQYLSRVVMNFHSVDEIADPNLRSLASKEAAISNQVERYNRSIAIRVSERWLYQTLETEAVYVYTFGQYDHVLRMKLRYAINDHWEATLGGDVFRGPPDTFYGRLRDNSAFYAQLKLSF